MTTTWLKNLRNFVFGRKATKSPTKKVSKSTTRLKVEGLEDRTVPAITYSFSYLDGDDSQIYSVGPNTIGSSITITDVGGEFRINGSPFLSSSGGNNVQSLELLTIDLSTDTATDSFNLSDVVDGDFGVLYITVTGAPGGKLTGSDSGVIYNINGNGAGDYSDGSISVTFTGISDLAGGSGANTFRMSNGVSLSGGITGGSSTDTLVYLGFAGGVTVDLGGGTATNITGGITSIENVTGGDGDDNLTDSSATNAITGGDGNDTLTFSTGNDTLNGGNGDDEYVLAFAAVNSDAVTVVDNGGNDKINFNGTDYGVTFDMDINTPQDLDLVGANTNTVTIQSGSDTIENFKGTAFNDIIFMDVNPSVVSRSVDGGIGGTDTLNYDTSKIVTTATLVVGPSSVTYAPPPSPAAAMTYTNIANLNINLSGDIVLNGSTGNDTLTVTATTTTDAAYSLSLNAGATVVSGSMTAVDRLRFNADDGNDVFNLNNQSGDLFATSDATLADDILYDAGNGNDRFNLTGAGAVGGSTATYDVGISATLGNGATAGTLAFVKGSTQNIQFSGMNDAGQSLNSDVVIATFTVNAGGGFSVSDETDDGVTRNRVTPNTGQFIDVSVVTSLVGHGSTAGDTISVGFTNTAIGSLTVNADDGNDTVNVTGNSVGTTINGDNDNDTINVSSNAPTNTGNLNGIAASLTLNLGAGTAGGDQAIVVSDFGEATTANNNVGVTSTQVTGFAGAANGTTITYSAGAGADNTTMTLRGSDTLSDTFNVTSTSASFTSTTIQGNGGNDAMNVSSDAPTNNGNLDAILGGLSLDLGNGTGAQSIVVSDFSAAAGNTVTLTNSTITGLAPVTITYGTGTGGTDTLTLRGSNTQADTFNVQSTNGGFNNSTVQGNGGDDNANVGSNAGVNNNGNLDNIAGQLTISLGADGGGSQAIVVSDFSAAADNTNVVVTNGSITGFAPASINYSTAGTKGDSLTLRGSDTNADTFNVQSTNVSFTSNSIQGNGGNDAINVSSDAPTNDGNLDAILGGLSLDLGNGTGAQSIVVSDFSAGAGNTVTLTNTQITGLAPVIINYTTGTGGTDTLILRGSNTQNDTFNIKSSSAAFTNTTVQGNGGDDSINVGSNAGVNNNGNLDNVAGQLTLSLGTDGGGNQAIVISDFGAGADNTNVVVTSGSITGFATAPINYSTAGNNVDTITLRGSDTNADTFNVQSTSASFTSTTIQGNGGNDAINVSSDAPTNNGNLDNIAGVLSLNLGNGTGAQSIVVSDFSAATDNTSVVVTNASITGFATAQINYNTGIGGTDTLTLRGSDTNADTFNVRSTSASFTSTTIQGNGGNDAINVSSDAPTNNGNLDNIAGVLSLNLGNGTGAQSIVVSDFSAAAGNTVTLTNSTITGLAPVTITYGTGTGGTDTLTLRGSNTQVDTFNVTSSNAAFTNTTVQGNGGNDNINVSSDAPTNSGNLAGIAGKLTLDLGAGTGAQAIVVSNFGGAAGTTATLTNTSITGFAPAQIDYAATAGGGAVNSITLRGADGFADTFNVQSTSANFSATGVQGNGGTDTFNVASDAPANVGNLDGILGILSIDGGAGANTLTVSDFSAAAGNGAVVINNANITGFAPVTINYAATGGAFSKITITGSNNAGVSENFTVNNPNGPLTLNANAGADTVNVQQISATANINGGDGNDIINVGNAGSMDTITAALTVVGGNQSDTINFNDAADVTNNTYTLTAVNLTRTGSSNVTFTTLEALTLNAGTGTNAINVTQTLATMPMTINGGTGNDTLTVPNTVNAWAINGTDTGTVNGTAITFNLGAGTNNVTGGSNSDTFTIGATGDISGTINGGSGTDTLNTSAFGGGVTFNLTSNNNGSTTGDNGLTFQSLESYVAGAGTDVFAFSNGVGVSGSINGGGGSDWLNYNAYLTAVVVNLSLNSATGVGGGVSNVENVIGGSGDDVLTGDGNANVLVGRGGNDRLIGNAGRDILIGGNGGDYMDGGDGEDIVVGGASTHENNITNLETDRSDWVANANPASAQMAAFLATVSNDGAVDRLRGGNQNDWFISSAGDILEDVTGGDVSSIV